ARLQRIVGMADEAAQEVQAELTRAVRRHGCFDSRESAVSFLGKALQRMDRRLGSIPSVPPRAIARRTAGAAAAHGVRAQGL
ncbi:MAG: hypothetical protein Q8L92_14070, partial [Rubrivivax sp.]|nr:hypothetical protein [Rubrivivax sp.]